VTAFFRRALLRRALRGCFGLALCVGAAACGGGGDTIGSGGGGGVAAASNVVDAAVTNGPTGTSSINVLYTTVTVCLPGTSTCQTIDNIQVDTGSYGLRILAPVLTLTFPVLALGNGSALVECTAFVDGYSWGPVTVADVQISGESASSVPVQIIGDSRYPSVPTDCVNSTQPNAEDTVASFGANGLLGIGPFAQDCGEGCVSGIPAPVYYSCPTESNCTGTTVPLADQVTNPITLFAADNNGSIITLPSVATAGAATVSGSLIFGIDTESNNASGTETVVPVAASGFLTSIFNGSTLDESFIDSGSNAYFFSDSSLSSSACQQSGFSGFYCPTSTTSLSGEMQLASGTSTVDFEIGNAEQISGSFAAFPGLGGTNPQPNSFDWGLPFFYGRRVAIAIQGATTSVGTGPYIAY
jgi:Protein of unknown function (DUF3443)